MSTKSPILHGLEEFALINRFRGKGPLSVALVVTEQARSMTFPLDPEAFIADSGTQVAGLGVASVQAILKRRGILRILAKEGGRTSRGSVGKMRKYVGFLNDAAIVGQIDFNLVEQFWVQRVESFFAGQPFTVKLDPSKGLRAVVRDVLDQAIKRQHESQGVTYAGAVLQHLVGAKLDCALAGDGITLHHFSFTTSDSQTDRAGDFFLGDVAIHVTTSPGEAVIRRCQENLDSGLRPIIVTLQKGLTVAEGLAANAGIADRLDVFEIEQFVALNLYELGKFKATGRRTAVDELVERYNSIVNEIETDPSMQIAVHK
ncbi:MAG: DUF4928 family protein [Terracidiphilus sp.]